MARAIRNNDTPANRTAFDTSATPPKRHSKISQVLALLRRERGATIAELVEATGWQPHTTRATLTGLRKKGHPVTKTSRDDATCYHVAS
jgi:DNA-binding MarR family transcriptional regulator